MDRMISSDQINRRYLDSWLFEVRHIGSTAADTGMDLFGHHFSTPVMTGALSHLNRFCSLDSERDGMTEYAQGARDAGAVCFSGMGKPDELARMLDTGAQVIKIIKTYRDRESIYARVRHAQEHGALAVGIDIDHAFNRESVYDRVDEMDISPITLEELKDLCASTRLPFIVKGVMSVQDAALCVRAGVGGIVVSHHNGRMDCTVPPLYMLPQIVKTVNGTLPVFVDCSLQNGQDIYRCMAFGAAACCVGRPLMQPLHEKGAAGVTEKLNEITRDLRYTMSMTGTENLSGISRSVLHRLEND